MKYEIGEQVKIKDNFSYLRYDDDPKVDPKMLDCAGRVFFVNRHHNQINKWYKLEDNPFIWDERWLEPAKDIAMTEDDIMEMLI